jgi:hypothetical protein
LTRRGRGLAKLPANDPAPTAEAGEHKRTPEEQRILDAFAEKFRNRVPEIKVMETKDGKTSLVSGYPEPIVGNVLIMNAIGTSDVNFYESFIVQLANAASVGPKLDEAATNFALSVVKGIAPRDQLEAMLAAQMAGIHMATMTFARRLVNADNLPSRDSAERTLNKLARTFTTQMEALKRYRSTGEQKMTVEHQHVTVNEGGQAIVGNVTTGGIPRKDHGQSHGNEITYAPGKTLPGNVEAVGEAVLRTGG